MCHYCDPVHYSWYELWRNSRLKEVKHVTDIKEIGKYGVMGTPALIINGEVKSVGSVPPKNKLIEWLKKAQE
ncbi:MAG: thioredoxin family protein [Dehalococcoidia bacterium]|nr:thioredoxin family protein [Dehalococcoidia bacterium]